MAKAQKRIAGSWTYVLAADRELPPDQQSRFVLKPLTGAERESYVDELRVHEVGRDGTLRIVSRMRTVARVMCLSHILSIERFPSDAPKAWPKEVEERKAYLEDLDDDAVFEIGNEIYNRSALGPEEAKHVGESLAPAPTSS